MNDEQVTAGPLLGAAQRVEAESIKPKARRRHRAQFRQQVIEEAEQQRVRRLRSASSSIAGRPRLGSPRM
jgi:hypothetical protein